MSSHSTDHSLTSPSISIPAYFVNLSTTMSWLHQNITRTPLLSVLTHTTSSSSVDPTQPGGAADGSAPTEEEGDSFGEHYFHICIYIWACVVVSSLIALSVKWGCCGRSLTRWEVKRIPLKRFHRAVGEDCQDKCPICHEDFHEGRFIRQLPCNHCYHSYCVDRWLVKMSNRCPLCKQRVSISLFCPWTKRQRKKEMHSNITSEAEAEAPPEDHPPLPPLSTLTPSNWYGEAIMSAPSKFILMRPGKPTRVIDLRDRACGDTSPEAPQETEVGVTPRPDDSSQCEDERPLTLVSSRSCSVSSDQPLLIELAGSSGDTDTGLSHHCGQQSNVATPCDSCQGNRASSQAEEEPPHRLSTSIDSEPLPGGKHVCWDGQHSSPSHTRGSDKRKVDMTVSISSVSSNIVTCSLTTAFDQAGANTPLHTGTTKQAWDVLEVEGQAEDADQVSRKSKAFNSGS